ncbi:MAG: tetratricopeptide repeat protein [Nitrospina sp.]|nr:tetratricopeptide repeat protein [Nitrospina sp.]
MKLFSIRGKKHWYYRNSFFNALHFFTVSKFDQPGPAMNHLLLKVFALLLLGLILTQCSNMSSADYVQEGIEHSRQGQYSSAKQSFIMAIEKDAKNIDGHYGLGGIYNLEKNYEDAEKSFQSAIQLDPTHINTWYSLGYTYELMGKKEEAEKSFEKYRRLKGKMDSIMSKEKP